MFRKNIDNWSKAGIVLFLLGISLGLTDYLVTPDKHSFELILIAVAALLASIRILSEYNLPILKLLTGITLTLALFSQAYFIESPYSAILGFVMLFASTAEYRKDLSKTG